MLYPAMLSPSDLPEYHRMLDVAQNAVHSAFDFVLGAIQDIQTAAEADERPAHATTILLMYEVAEALDGVGSLVANGAARNCRALLRVALEGQLSLMYIWEANATYEERSLAYQYAYWRKQLKWAKKADPDDSAGKQVRKDIAGQPHDDVFEVMDTGVEPKKEIEKINAILANSVFDPVRTAWTEVESRGDPKWYQLSNGPKSMLKLAAGLAKGPAYETLYRGYSEFTHAEDAMGRMKGGDEAHSYLLPIRSPEGLESVCRNACVIAVETVRVAVTKLLPARWEAHRKVYLEAVRPALLRFNLLRQVDPPV